MQSTTSSRGSGSVRPRPTSRTKRPRRPSPEARLRALGLTPKMAYAIRVWIGTHTIDRNFSARQITYDGLCHPSSFSRAKSLLLGKGLMVQLCEHRPPVKGSAEKGLDALYRFTEAAYELVLRAPSRRAERTSPGLCENHSESTSYPKHEHVPSGPADAPLRDKEASGEKPREDLAPVVRLLVEEGLGQRGAEAVAKALPTTVDESLLPYLLEVTRETVAKRSLRRDGPEPLKVHLLRTLDPELLQAARSRQRAAAEWKRSTAGLAWEGLSRPFRAHPGASEALGRLLKAQEVAQAVRPGAAGHLPALDQLREARRELLDLILAAAGEGLRAHWEATVRRGLLESSAQPDSLAWKRNWGIRMRAEAFRWAGLPESTH